MTEKLAYFPLLGTCGPQGPDHMAEQVHQTAGFEEPSRAVEDGADPNIYWRAREGELIVITTLSERHLRNCLRLLWRAADRWSLVEAMTGGMVNEDEEAVEYAGELGGARPSQLILMSPYRPRGEPLLKEWARRGFAEDTWWAA